MASWRELIRYWTMNETGRTNGYYQVGLVVPFEWMLDPLQGPPLMERLAVLYRKAGFETLPSSDIPCVWYHMASKELQRQKELLSEYIPGYTITQREYMLKQVEEMVQDYKDDKDPFLKVLLQEYKDQILHDTRIDIPALQDN